MKILLAYASAHGSTAEVAEEIGRVLSGHDLDVTVENILNINQVQDYDALVVGSAVHAGAWLPEVTTLLESLDNVWAAKPIYMWLSCIRVLEQYGDDHVREFYLRHDLLKQLAVREVALFPGKLDLANTDWNERWTLAARYDGSTWPSGFDGDFRDWDKIRTWAGQVAQELLNVGSVESTG